MAKQSDYYSDQPEAEGTPAEEAGETPAEEAKEKEGKEDEEGTTALLPKAILAGKTFNPGDEVVLKIVHMYENEVEVAYATEEKGKGEGKGSEGKESEMDRSMGALDQMAMKSSGGGAY